MMTSLILAFLAMVTGAIQWQRPVDLARGGGERGPWQQNNSRYDFVDDPSVALMANGDAALVWVDQVFVTWDYTPRREDRPHGIGIAYSGDNGASFTQPQLVPGTQDAGPNGGFEGRLMRKLAVRDNAIVVVNSAKREGKSSRVWMVRGRF